MLFPLGQPHPSHDDAPQLIIIKVLAAAAHVAASSQTGWIPFLSSLETTGYIVLLFYKGRPRSHYVNVVTNDGSLAEPEDRQYAMHAMHAMHAATTMPCPPGLRPESVGKSSG